ncbi:MAG: hypothetical protein ABEI74_01265 [Candidatus Pacearchaeota archaeon]
MHKRAVYTPGESFGNTGSESEDHGELLKTLDDYVNEARDFGGKVKNSESQKDLGYYSFYLGLYVRKSLEEFKRVSREFLFDYYMGRGNYGEGEIRYLEKNLFSYKQELLSIMDDYSNEIFYIAEKLKDRADLDYSEELFKNSLESTPHSVGGYEAVLENVDMQSSDKVGGRSDSYGSSKDLKKNSE